MHKEHEDLTLECLDIFPFKQMQTTSDIATGLKAIMLYGRLLANQSPTVMMVAGMTRADIEFYTSLTDSNAAQLSIEHHLRVLRFISRLCKRVA